MPGSPRPEKTLLSESVKKKSVFGVLEALPFLFSFVFVPTFFLQNLPLPCSEYSRKKSQRWSGSTVLPRGWVSGPVQSPLEKANPSRTEPGSPDLNPDSPTNALGRFASSPFPYMQNVDNNSTYLIKSFWRLNELIGTKYLEQGAAHNMDYLRVCQRWADKERNCYFSRKYYWW